MRILSLSLSRAPTISDWLAHLSYVLLVLSTVRPREYLVALCAVPWV